MKTIAVITATRAEYGLLAPLIRALRKQGKEKLYVELIVTGTHLSQDYGMTVREIEEDGEHIDRTVPVSVKSDTAKDISGDQAEILVKFTALFSEKRYEAIVILGDRYEMLAIAVAAGNTHTPLFHLCGGDTTEGAADEWIRHAITKMSYLHFVTNKDSARRVIQLGEDPERVFNYGSTSIDNIMQLAGMTKQEVLASVGLGLCNYVLCTYHPVTMGQEDVKYLIGQLLTTIQTFPGLDFIVTKANADQGGEEINALLGKADAELPNLHLYASLGVRRYLSAMKHAELVLGNSSSGIIEAPALGVPTVNIGERQRGRLRSESVIDCGTSAQSIISAIQKARGEEFREMCRNVISPYGDGNTAERIASKIIQYVCEEEIDLRKSFYDIGVER